MKNITTSQKEMIDEWIQEAEKPELKPIDIVTLDKKISAIINSIEYERPLQYYARLIL